MNADNLLAFTIFLGFRADKDRSQNTVLYCPILNERIQYTTLIIKPLVPIFYDKNPSKNRTM